MAEIYLGLLIWSGVWLWIMQSTVAPIPKEDEFRELVAYAVLTLVFIVSFFGLLFPILRELTSAISRLIGVL